MSKPVGSRGYRLTYPVTTDPAASGGGGGASLFIIDPSSPPGGSIYNTFAQAVAAAASVQGPKVYEFRGGLAVIAAGAYALGSDPVTIKGQWDVTAAFTPTGLAIAAGVTFSGPASVTFDGVALSVAALAVPVITLGGSANAGAVRFTNNSSLAMAGTVPFIRAVPGTSFAPVRIDNCQGGGFFTPGGGSAFAAVGAGAAGLLAVKEGVVTADSVAASAGGSMLVQIISPAAAVANAQAGIAGGVLVSGVTLAREGVLDRLQGEEAVAITDVAATTITRTQGALRRVNANSQASVLTLSNTGAEGGAFPLGGGDDMITVVKPTKENFTYRINRADGTALVIIPGLSAGSFRFQFDGANWAIRDGGTWL